MHLSILDQSPISANKSAQDALHTSIKLAQLGEELGYKRFWIAEHHDLYGLACSNPDVMLGVIGAQTKKIRIGAGAVLLPYYKPFRIAETYNLLGTLYPGRIDLGIGRAPGGSAEVSLALSDNYLKQVNAYPQLIDELLQFIHQQHPENDPYGKISPTPVPDIAPKTWLLGTSEKSAILAAEKGVDYAFGHFMSGLDGPEIVKIYRDNFRKKFDREAYVIVAIHVVCAETTALAEELALSHFLWQIRQEKNIEQQERIPTMEEAKNYPYTDEDLKKIAKMKRKTIIGDSREVKKQMLKLNERYEADEMMIVTITHEEEAKFNSYRFIAESFSSYKEVY